MRTSARRCLPLRVETRDTCLAFRAPRRFSMLRVLLWFSIPRVLLWFTMLRVLLWFSALPFLLGPRCCWLNMHRINSTEPVSQHSSGSGSDHSREDPLIVSVYTGEGDAEVHTEYFHRTNVRAHRRNSAM